jgi:hypothetical protein
MRALALAALVVAMPLGLAAQALSVLHIKVVVAGPDGTAIPVAKHVLQVSDNPATGLPRRIVTGTDGTADVRLRPGSYTVESDRQAVLNGNAYQWMQIVEIAAGRDAVLELTAANAEVEAATPDMIAAVTTAKLSSDLSDWKDSLVAVWTPTARTSGFLVDARGLIASDHRAIGTATSVEVQLSPVLKVAATVVEADADRDVAILRINPATAASLKPAPLGCVDADRLTRGTGRGLADERAPLRVEDVCALLASAEKKVKDAAPPAETRLPVEPARPFPVDALKDALQKRAGAASPYKMSSSDFDIAFITPILTYIARHPPDRTTGRTRAGETPAQDAQPEVVRPLLDFANWADYVTDYPPVVLVRVTPKLAEGFWTTFGRMAARTQGVSIPPIKHFKSDFSRMHMLCGDVEVPAIHPFILEHQISEKDSLHEGLYVFDPATLGACGVPLKLVLFSVKEPAKGDTRVVDPKIIEQVQQDFAPYRAQQ